MEVELFIIVALVVVFLVSCCGLIQKIKENYNEDGGRIISVTQIRVPNQMYNNSAFQADDEFSSGVFPDTLAPPPYTEHIEPPPKYEDLIKEGEHTIIQMNPSSIAVPQTPYGYQNEAAALPQYAELPTVPPTAAAR